LSQIEDINAGLLGIVVRVRSLPDSTPYDCLCQTEISKRAISLSRAVSQLKAPTVEDIHHLIPHITTLPLPPDLCLSELTQFAISLPLPPVNNKSS
jgi:hypothetical protein